MAAYTKTLPELFVSLKTSEQGLTQSDVARRLLTHGPNELAVKKEPLWRIILEPFSNVFVGVLIAAVLISLMSREILDAAIISIIILINAVIFYTQHYATTRVLRNLKKQTAGQVNVVRDGEQQLVPTVNLVPGDILLLSEGERVPADARILDADNLQLNESALTGESVPVHKHAALLHGTKQIYEQANMIFQGTYVLSGTGKAVVTATGRQTEFGKIAKLATDEQTKSPVQAKINNLVGLLIKVIGGIALIVFALELARGIPIDEALRFVLSLTVSAVPEDLPIALTVIIVLGMRRMAKKKALVRSFKAIEDVGLVTTIATDKTGTLTKNHLTVVDMWALGKEDILTIAGRTLDASEKATDPLDAAIIEKTTKKTTVDEVYPFDLSLRLSGAFHHKEQLIYLKGSPEHMLAKSTVTAVERHRAESAMHELASKGYRVIAIGTYPAKVPPANLSQVDRIHFVGFVALADELRPEAAPAIKAAQRAGISVRLITGDHFETAYNIGKQVGLAQHPNQVIQGVDLPQTPAALKAVIKDKTVFARILPEDKFKILSALKQTEITAMTGDGVNDVPALANAHVGIAMGSGSDIAKDAGGIVLLNDNFATIVKAIAEGRKIYDNIRRMTFYLLSTSLGEVLTMIGALLFNLPLPVTAIQILWINLVTDTAFVLPLGLEPAEKGHMKRPPRRPNERLLSNALLSRMVIVGLVMASVTLAIVTVLHQRGESLGYIQTTAFMALIAAQWVNAFNARSEHESVMTRLKTMNPWMIVGLIVAVVLQGLVMFGPLASVFDVHPVPLSTLALSSGAMAAAVLASVELHKFIVRRQRR